MCKLERSLWQKIQPRNVSPFNEPSEIARPTSRNVATGSTVFEKLEKCLIIFTEISTTKAICD